MALLALKRQLPLATRLGTAIENAIDLSALPAGQVQQAADYRKSYKIAKHRPTKACNTYNCHGLTFASRRTRIWNPSEVQKILTEDGYVEVPLASVLIGDVIVYRNGQSGDWEHSGVVIDDGRPKEELELQVPWILSKWGSAHEVIHPWNDCPYVPGCFPLYYRMEQ